MTKSDGNKRWDYRQDLINQATNLIETGTAPWQNPGNSIAASAALEFPYYAATGRAYRDMKVVYAPSHTNELLAKDSANEQKRERSSQSAVDARAHAAKHIAPETALSIPKKDADQHKGLTIFASDSHTAQHVSKKSTATHSRDDFENASKVGGEICGVYKIGKPQVLTTQAQETELTALVHEQISNDVQIIYAQDNTGRNEYDGPILDETGSHIIQKLNDKQVVIHSKVNLQHDVEVGDRVAIVYEHGKTYVDELSADKEARRAKHEARERGQSAYEQIKERFGDAKFVDVEKGSFTGTIVAEDDKTLIQRIGANRFIAHQKQNIAPNDNIAIGNFVRIEYAQGKAEAVNMQKSQRQQKGQEREFARTWK